MAPPTKTTPEVIERICAHLEQALHFTTSCRLEGINPDVFRHYLANHAEVRERVERAKAVGEVSLVGLTRALTADGKPTGGVQFLLERLYPKRWAKNPVVRTEVSGPGGKPLQAEVEHKFEVDPRDIEGLIRIARGETKK